MALRFTCGEEKICENIKKCQNIMTSIIDGHLIFLRSKWHRNFFFWVTSIKTNLHFYAEKHKNFCLKILKSAMRVTWFAIRMGWDDWVAKRRASLTSPELCTSKAITFCRMYFTTFFKESYISSIIWTMKSSFPQKDGGLFCRALGDIKFSSTSWGDSAKLGV